MQIPDSTLALAARVEAFVREIVIPYERLPTGGGHGPREEMLAALAAARRKGRAEDPLPVAG